MYDILTLEENLFDAIPSEISCAAMRLFVRNADDLMEPLRISELDGQLLKSTRLFHTSSVTLGQEPARSATYEAIDIAKAAGAIISYAPNYNIHHWSDMPKAMKFLRSLIATADIIFLTSSELPLLTSETEPEKAADAMVDQGVKIILIQNNAGGLFLRIGNESKLIPVFADNKHLTHAQNSVYASFLFRFLLSGKPLKTVKIDDAESFISGVSVNI